MNIPLLAAVTGTLGVVGGFVWGAQRRSAQRKQTAVVQGVPKDNYGWHMRDVSLALRRKDCEAARSAVTAAMRITKTKKQSQANHKALLKIQRCELE